MHTFKDSLNITVSSGDGGSGSISFLRERFKAKGGPDGGNGGRGGNVIFKVKTNLKTLSLYKNGQRLSASDGKPGMGSKKSGASGENLVVFVPPNTRVYDAVTDSVLFELQSFDEEVIVLKGGRGGLGNANFKSSTRRTPRFAQPGESGMTLNLRLELSLIADIGIVGLPNAGKSSLISTITASKSKVANYPFTTKVPHLGVIKSYCYDLVIADVPGIIEGSSRGLGLGFEFLRHISKTKVLVFLIDVASNNFLSDYNILFNELGKYNVEFLSKKRVIVANKLDLDGAVDRFNELKRALGSERILGISIYENRGIDELVSELFTLSEI
ncbi:GTPase ObgE [Borrelia miyamotoi]|uniref:GTPase Obg n=1 Tax=Borrelia miyamotoi TaxID=47466 RepID=A0AAX3JMS1_9SPIR|nr:GTPase ObgE [Borrelia miyamotoi]QFP42287.1 GTPase ObgE [Borrelia miyamotoi]QFP48400.1 GTPase ObgE [Borrelia miyamotoi]QGT56161.1 GTPase ObgE [Borrelia miyamotoi]QGT56942.1 GTPase ObgE [Borrelia miyamotoi]WAZ72207.1 GTPase ObgE [Borrelia miyamotoi]